jgi:hypothetical protein
MYGISDTRYVNAIKSRAMARAIKNSNAGDSVNMIQLFFLVPILMSAIWYWYLSSNNYTIKQGLKGFGYIFAFNATIIAFFILMLFITH